MALRPLAQRVLASHARPEVFVDKAVAILGRLGYRILNVSDWQAVEAPPAEAELLLIDERLHDELHEVSDLERFRAIPRIVLTGRGGVQIEDPAIVGAIRRPAGLHDLYRVIQQVFEDTPRTIPRVTTQIPVACSRRGDAFDGALLSISENGGLLRCDASLPLGVNFDMRFELPGCGELALAAEAAYQLLPNVGVVFSGLPPEHRTAIGDYVSGVLLT